MEKVSEPLVPEKTKKNQKSYKNFKKLQIIFKKGKDKFVILKSEKTFRYI